MSKKIRIYLDSGADVTGIKDLHSLCEFVISPYDHPSNRRKDVEWEIGIHPELQWRDCNWPWNEWNQSWESHVGSEYFEEIYKIIGCDPRNRRDGLHLDSAYKSKCLAFLTSDKRDIWTNRKTLQELLGFSIFHPPTELAQLRKFVEKK